LPGTGMKWDSMHLKTFDCWWNIANEKICKFRVGKKFQKFCNDSPSPTSSTHLSCASGPLVKGPSSSPMTKLTSWARVINILPLSAFTCSLYVLVDRVKRMRCHKRGSSVAQHVAEKFVHQPSVHDKEGISALLHPVSVCYPSQPLTWIPKVC